eukprot:1161941-Pelagomonas_calceolata.AAC.3
MPYGLGMVGWDAGGRVRCLLGVSPTSDAPPSPKSTSKSFRYAMEAHLMHSNASSFLQIRQAACAWRGSAHPA